MLATNEMHLERMRTILNRMGIREVLAYLNDLTEHRFTALYRFEDETLRNLYFFDRDNPEIDWTPEIPVLASYCTYVRDTGELFSMSNSVEDRRVLGHAKRLEVKAYCGVPLLDDEGKMFGSLCHFDPEPREISTENIALLRSVAQLLRPAAAA